MKDLALETRKDFPLFDIQSGDLNPIVYLDHAATSQKPRQVIDKLVQFYTDYKVQPYSPFPAAEFAGQAMDKTLESVSAMLNVSATTMHFGPSTSQNTYVLSQSFLSKMKPF